MDGKTQQHPIVEKKQECLFDIISSLFTSILGEHVITSFEKGKQNETTKRDSGSFSVSIVTTINANHLPYTTLYYQLLEIE